MAFGKFVKPESAVLLHLTVLRTEQLSAHWIRVTLGGGEVERFRPMGFDQWFRLFLPIGGDAGLDRVPAKANRMFGYLKFLRTRRARAHHRRGPHVQPRAWGRPGAARRR